MNYEPSNVPLDPKQLVEFLSRELPRVSAAIGSAQRQETAVVHITPTKPVNGIYYADGSDWDPGSGRGLYRYDEDSATYSHLIDIVDTPSDGEVLVFNGTSGRWEAGEVPDAALSDNVPLLDAANVFTNILSVASTGPQRRIVETDATTDEGTWREFAQGDILNFGTLNDAGTSGNSWLRVLRTGITIDEIELNATTLDFNGKVDTQASASGGAGFNVPHGAAPSSPVDGDIWTTTSGLFARINGVTVQFATV